MNGSFSLRCMTKMSLDWNETECPAAVFSNHLFGQVSNNDAISPGSGIKRLVDFLEKMRVSLQAKTDAVDSEKLLLLEAEVTQMVNAALTYLNAS